MSTVDLSDELLEALETVSREMHCGKDWVIDQALRRYLDERKQGQRRWQETLPSLALVEAGHVVDGEVVERWLQSWGTPEERDIQLP